MRDQNLYAGFLLAALLSTAAPAQEIAVPVETHVRLLAKVLEYDRVFTGKTREEVVLGIAYQKAWHVSAAACVEVTSLLRRPSFAIGGHPVRIVFLDLGQNGSGPDLGGLDLLYIAPLRTEAWSLLREALRNARVLTLTGVPEYVADGAAIGIGLQNDRPQIMINLPAARAQGADLSAQVLRLARVVH